MGDLITSGRGLKLIQKWEGLYLHAYQDSVGVWTIGWGTITSDVLGISVRSGMTITREEAENYLAIEIREKELAILKMVKVPLSQNQFDALVSFAYNLGIGTLKQSTLLKLLNRGNYGAVPTQLNRYVNAGGRRLRGLVNRRRDEVRMWNGEHIEDVPDTPLIRVPAAHITPTVAEKPLATTLDSATGKAAGGQIVVALGAATQMVNPLVVGALLVVAGVGGYILWKKYHDTMELR